MKARGKEYCDDDHIARLANVGKRRDEVGSVVVIHHRMLLVDRFLHRFAGNEDVVVARQKSLR